MTVLQYERSEEERRVRDRLAQIEEEFEADSRVRASFESAWRSSASAFEFVLARHTALLESPSAGTKSRADPIVLERSARIAGELPHAGWSNPDGAARALIDLLREVGAIERDSKLEAFLAHVGQPHTDSKIVTFTAMRQTAIYLAVALDIPTVSSMVLGRQSTGFPPTTHAW